MFGRLLDRIAARFPRFGRFREWAAVRKKRIVAAAVVLMHLLGAASSVNAVMSTRTSQGAIAWVVSLNTFPWVAVPAYWVFGQSKFDGYEMLRRQQLQAGSEMEDRALRVLRERGMLVEPENERYRSRVLLLQNLSQMPLTRYNDVDLLIDGEETFDAIIDSISRAEDYVLVQFYILRSDGLGHRLKDALLERAARGVRVHVLYDALGSHGLGESYLAELQQAGVIARPFVATRSATRFQLNFRNHRKIVVVDGREAFVGGHNVGDEYLGLDSKLSPWRDTHVAFRGPVVLAAQVAFAEDWQWATGEVPELNWEPEQAPGGNALAMCLPTGPADEFETGTLMMLDLINGARQRLWIASPYFVPDEQIISALQLAALRGVDVRVLIPEQNDDRLVDLTSWSYLEELDKVGIRYFRYQPGFMHQKVLLIDDNLAAVGTANFDNRSMRLNFEVTMLFADEDFAADVERMLRDDFSRSREVTVDEYTDSSAVFRFLVKTARLLAPVQ